MSIALLLPAEPLSIMTSKTICTVKELKYDLTMTASGILELSMQTDIWTR